MPAAFSSRPNSERVLPPKALATLLGTSNRGRPPAVFVAGCFDFLHPGSLSLIKAARGFGSPLVVLVWDDQTAAQLHGYPPVNPAADRVRLMVALKSVDFGLVTAPEAMPQLFSSIPTGMMCVWENDPLLPRLNRLRRASNVTLKLVPTTDPRSSLDYLEPFRRALL